LSSKTLWMFYIWKFQNHWLGPIHPFHSGFPMVLLLMFPKFQINFHKNTPNKVINVFVTFSYNPNESPKVVVWKHKHVANQDDAPKKCIYLVYIYTIWQPCHKVGVLIMLSNKQLFTINPFIITPLVTFFLVTLTNYDLNVYSRIPYKPLLDCDYREEKNITK